MAKCICYYFSTFCFQLFALVFLFSLVMPLFIFMQLRNSKKIV